MTEKEKQRAEMKAEVKRKIHELMARTGQKFTEADIEWAAESSCKNLDHTPEQIEEHNNKVRGMLLAIYQQAPSIIPMVEESIRSQLKALEAGLEDSSFTRADPSVVRKKLESLNINGLDDTELFLTYTATILTWKRVQAAMLGQLAGKPGPQVH